MQRLILLTSTLLLASACGRPATNGPQGALRRYINAVRANQPLAAYALLSPQAQKSLPKEEFLDRWRRFRPELLHQAKEMEAALADKLLRLNAQVALPQGQTRRLRYEKGWRLSDGVHTIAAKTPRDAVLALIAAAERRDYQAVKAMMTPRVAKAFEEQIDKRIKAVRAGLAQGLRVSGDRASLRFGRFKLELVKVGGRWRVYDFD